MSPQGVSKAKGTVMFIIQGPLGTPGSARSTHHVSPPVVISTPHPPSYGEAETLRCLALAMKQMPSDQRTAEPSDETDLTFLGLVRLKLI